MAGSGYFLAFSTISKPFRRTNGLKFILEVKLWLSSVRVTPVKEKTHLTEMTFSAQVEKVHTLHTLGANATTSRPRKMPMEYKSIQERNCNDALRHLLEARCAGQSWQIAAAEKEFRLTMKMVKDTAPKVWEKHQSYLDEIDT